MYPVRLGYDTAVTRIRRLMRNDHHAEALITSVFTVEKGRNDYAILMPGLPENLNPCGRSVP
jgi:hypothetical protein